MAQGTRHKKGTRDKVQDVRKMKAQGRRSLGGGVAKIQSHYLASGIRHLTTGIYNQT